MKEIVVFFFPGVGICVNWASIQNLKNASIDFSEMARDCIALKDNCFDLNWGVGGREEKNGTTTSMDATCSRVV